MHEKILNVFSFSRERAEEEEKEIQHQKWLKEREEKITAIQQALKHHGTKGL